MTQRPVASPPTVARRSSAWLHTDWDRYLHALRAREIDLIFGRCPQGLFQRGLELGAGDGYQSGLLQRYVQHLTCTDFGADWFAGPSRPGMTFQTCDAEQVDAEFPPGAFDLIFSSNMMEHLPDPGRALRGMHRVLANHGVVVHVMPSPFWKLASLALYLPHKLSRLVERATGGDLRTMVAREWAKDRGCAPEGATEKAWDNNPKIQRRPQSFLARQLVPVPHGVSATHIEELRAFQRTRWAALFHECGFEVVSMFGGPVSSGYGFGLDRIRTRLERLGLSSENVFVAIKLGQSSPLAQQIGPGLGAPAPQ